MLTLGIVSFAVPWALLALATLPILWWLLRVMPPAPWLVRFPPVRLLLALTSREETAAKSPLWLLILRMVLLTMIILAVAHPLVNAVARLADAGPVVVVVDDGWAAARNWAGRAAALTDVLDQAERQHRPLVVTTTAPTGAAADGAAMSARMMSATEARRALEALQPKPWPTDREARVEPLLGPDALAVGRASRVLWLSDGLGGEAAAQLAERLRRLGPLTVVSDQVENLALVLRPPVADGAALRIKVERAATGIEERAWLRMLGEDGRLLAREALAFERNTREAELRLDLPNELRNRLARIEIENQGTAGAVVLMDERWRRRPVGLVSTQGAVAEEQPLLNNLYYLERALEPFTEVRRGTVDELLQRRLAVLILVDSGPLAPTERARVEKWIGDGGVVVRFAGPRLAQEADDLLPVRLRGGDRTLGGSLSWSVPAALAPFPPASPFHGLDVPADVKVARQVLAQPALDLAEKTWAALSDGTPLVTAARNGKGWLTLVHTTANAAWSNLPLSGLFVEMLQRIVGLSQGVVGEGTAVSLGPLQILDGFGHLGPAPTHVLAIAGERFTTTVAGPDHPPGYYGEETSRRALNLPAGLPSPRAMAGLGPDVARQGYERVRETDLKPWLLVVAFVLAIVDLAASLVLRGLVRFGRAAAATVAVATLAVGAPQVAAQTPNDAAMAASLETRLAYVITGDAEVDETSRAGLWGLSVVINQRTAAELSQPMGVVPETDDLAFYPLLYWPITDVAPSISTLAADKLNQFMHNGGTILFDTRDGDGRSKMGILHRMSELVDIPPLVPLPSDHVLTRAYYLMSDLPGRWTGGTIWVERAGERVNDGVSSVIAGGHDWAAAWAMDDAQRPLFPLVPGGDRQRELAYRFGINLVMYTLTGNYKSDQVHLPSILERLGL